MHYAGLLAIAAYKSPQSFRAYISHSHLLPLPISVVRTAGRDRWGGSSLGPSRGCNLTAAGARTAEGLEQLRTSLQVLSSEALVGAPSPPGSLRVRKGFGASIAAPNTAAASAHGVASEVMQHHFYHIGSGTSESDVCADSRVLSFNSSWRMVRF